jgi:hypothetical protein
MADYLTINNVSLAKNEAVSGTEEALVAADDAMKMEDATLLFDPETIDTNEAAATLDQSDPVLGGGPATYNATWNMKGSGTAGVAPQVDPMLRSCALGVTLRAADKTNTAAAGSASDITLFAGEGTDVIAGEIIELTGGTGAGQRRVITAPPIADVALIYPDWTTPPDATSVYVIRASVVYAKVDVDCESLTTHLWHNSKRTGVNAWQYQMKGGASTAVLTFANGQVGKCAFTTTGQIVDRLSAAPLTGLVFDIAPKLSLRKADSFFDGKVAKFREFSIDLGNEVNQPDNPAEEWARDFAVVTRRNTLVNINLYARVLSDYDAWADIQAGTSREMWLNYGGGVGKNVSVYLPTLVPARSIEKEDLDGFAAEGLQFKASGDGTGFFLCIW